MPRLLPRRSLVGTFALLSLAIIIVIGVVVGLVLRETVRDRAIVDAARTAEVAAGVGVLPVLDPADLDRSFLPLDPDRLASIDRSLGATLSPNGIVRIKVWNRQHWLVYSDNPNLIGRWFAGSELLEASFDGDVTSEITDLTAPEEREERDFGELLSVYVPLRVDEVGNFTNLDSGEVVGAFEIYLPYAPIAAQINRDTARLGVALAGGLLLLYVVLYRIVARAARTIRRQGDENLRRATRDELTGLANRERFQQHLVEVIDRRSREEGGTVSLLLFDIDGFQTINDTLGHDSGDEVIQQIAMRLSAAVRPVDVVARLGGDEFGVIVDGAEPGETHRTVAERLVRTLSEPVDVGGIALDVNCSVGVSRFPDDGATAADLLRHADIAMYSAKREQTVIEIFEPALDHFSADSLSLVGDVRASITDDDFWLAYQPQVAFDTGAVVGYEALVRWDHPQRGFVPAGRFIPVLETLPACRELTNHVLGLAVVQLAMWSAQGFRPSVAVNLSARDASDMQLPVFVAALLDEFEIDPHQLHLELTETTVLANPDRTRVVLERLRLLGCTLAIDDFGTGYASMSHLRTLPVTCLKIDRSFVEGVGNDQRSTALVQHSIDLGHALGMSVVAEGIETAEVYDRLQAMGCDLAQGYFISKPMPADELVVPTTVGGVA